MKRCLAWGIALSLLILVLSLISYFFPGALSQAAKSAAQNSRRLAQAAGERLKPPPSSAGPEETKPPAQTAQAEPVQSSLSQETEAAISQPQVYDLMLDTCAGPMLYYSQHDSRWSGYLYGGTDPMDAYGCGPTAAAMAVNAFAYPITPNAMADWAAANGYFSQGNGSLHSLIPEALSAFGLPVSSVSDRSPQNAAALLESGHILIALMGKGTFADSGHFILITQLYPDGSVSIADPNSLENTMARWSLDQLMAELKKAYDSGGPLWAVSLS